MRNPLPHAVRDAAAPDADAIARVHVDAWRETYSGVLDERYFSEESFGRRREYWASYLSADPREGRMVVAELGDEIVGFASSGDAVPSDGEHAHPPARSLQVFTIYLLRRVHGSGLGQQMLDAVVDGEPAQLWVLKGNARAIAFYERNGFIADGITVDVPAEPQRIEIRMER